MAGKEAAANAGLVGNQDPESDAEKAGSGRQATAEPPESSAGVSVRHGDGGRDKRHAGHGTHAKYEQVDHCPSRIVNRGQHEQGDRGRSGKSVNHSDQQRAQHLIKAKPSMPTAKVAIETRDRRFGVVPIGVPLMTMNVAVNIRTVRVCVPGGRRRSKTLGDPARDAHQVQQAQQNQHNTDRQFHSQAEARRNYEIKHNDRSADGHDGEGVSDSPECSDEGGTADGSLPGDDGTHGNDMVRVGSMTHTQQKSEQCDCDKAVHVSSSGARRIATLPG